MEPLTFDGTRVRPADQPREIAARVRSRFGSWPAAALAGLALAILYAPVIWRLVHTWWIDENYSHGFLVLPLAGYLAWERRGRLARSPRHPSNLGLVVVLGSLLVLLVGVFSAEVFLTRLSMLGVAGGTVLYLLGWRHLRIVAFPLAFLLLMIPIPAILFNHVALPLQLLASKLGETVLALAGVPVLREGNVITLAHARLEVAEACSGIRSLVSLLALAVIYGYFVDRRTWARIALAIVAVPVAILVNGLRVAGTGLLAQRFGAAAAQGFFHGFSGWLMFLVAFAMLVGIERLLLAGTGDLTAATTPDHLQPDQTLNSTQEPGTRDPSTRVTKAARSGQAPSTRVTKTARSGQASAHGTRDQRLRLVILASCLFAAAGVVQARSRPETEHPRERLTLLPSVIDGWQGVPGPPLDDQTVNALGVDDFVNRVYSVGGQPPVALYIGYYKSQREGDTIHSPLNCLPGAGWEPVSRTEAHFTVRERLDTSSTRSIAVNRLVIEKGADRALVFYWYQSHGRVVANEYAGRLMLAFDAVRLNRTDGALVRIVTPVAGSDAGTQAAAERTATAFVESLFPLLGRYIPR